MPEIKLTQTVKKGGCAAKLPAGKLRDVLSKVLPPKSQQLLVGAETWDDACVWALNQQQHLLQTLDFFTPIVDSPRDFGAVAAANALSDIYAMGGKPALALTILAFPLGTLSLDVLEELLNGAFGKIGESGASVAGGHSIDDDSLKLGFSVTGFVEREKLWTNAGAREGDRLILTKALGTGTLTSALKSGSAEEDWAAAAIESMKMLNDLVDLVPVGAVNAATDITGFGLAGHAFQMARASRVKFCFETESLPQLPGAKQCLEKLILNRAHKTNEEYVQSQVVYDERVPEYLRWLTVDPQTSGGLLLSVAPAYSEKLLENVRSKFPRTTEIGRVVSQGEKFVEFQI